MCAPLRKLFASLGVPSWLQACIQRYTRIRIFDLVR